jgi:hypothetical protein
MKALQIATALFLSLFVFETSMAQSELFMPKNIIKAYQDGSRSFDGKQGKNYFQNTTNYTIEVEFNPQSRLLSGSETINFTNNSPDSLASVVLNLYGNLYKKGAARRVAIDSGDAGEGFVLHKLIFNDETIDLESKAVSIRGPNLTVKLPRAIQSGASVKFTIDWQFVFPANTNIREGRYYQTNYFIAYWYPRIAVYDDVNGWNKHYYSGEQEFYSEYGDFDVKVTVPKNHLVWASGLLQNPNEVYEKKVFKRFKKSKTTDEIIHIVSKKDIEKGELTADREFNTWHFKSEYLSDFAFATSNTYLWDATSVEIGAKRIPVNAVYYEGSADFHEVAELSRQSLKLLSENAIGVDYPFPQLTAFNGHYGMEFPMMINDGDMSNRKETIFVTAHEIAHSYFPFLVGTNEQKYAWMDEGLVTFLPKEIEVIMSDDSTYNAQKNMILTYSYFAGSKYDLPLMIPSEQLTGRTYMYLSYSKAAAAFYTLRDILGKEVFQKCIREFIERWEGKHPIAYDFFFSFENVSEENLDWFWKPWFFEFGFPDLTISNVVKENDSTYAIDIEKIGNYPTPVYLTVNFADGSQEYIHESAKTWNGGGAHLQIALKTNKEISTVEINRKKVPDANTGNNVYEMKKAINE